MVYSISNTNHNKQTRLGLRFILSTQYAYWLLGLLVPQLAPGGPQLVLETRLVMETRLLLEQVTCYWRPDFYLKPGLY